MIYSYFEKLLDPLDSRDVERPPQSVADFFRFYLSPHKKIIFWALLISGIASVSELFLYLFLGKLLDWMTIGSRDGFFGDHAPALFFMLFLTAVVRPVAQLASRAILNLALAPGLANATRWHNHRYVIRQSLGFFQNDFSGRVAQKVMQTGNALREAVFNVIDGIWFLVIYLVGILVFFIDIHLRLMIPVLIWLAGYGLVIYFMVPPVRIKSAALSEANSGLTGRIVDSYTNIQSVKLFAHAEHEEDYMAEGLRNHTYRFRVLMRAILDMTVALTILNTLLVVATAILSIIMWQHSTVTVGEIAVVNALIIRLVQMSGWILRTVTSLFENVGTVQNGMETISRNNLILDTPDARTLEVGEGKIQFDNVTFKYGSDIGVIENCSFDIAAGERVGLVGRSGAGKSTLVSLLMRFYELEAGTIRIDGNNIREVTQDSLRKHISVVTQDTSLLHRSIRDNIGYGRINAAEGEVLDAASTASATEFIKDLVDSGGRLGFDAMVGERGVKLSGGQRQRIAIARVILKNAPILVLDEATSALDSEVEAAIQQQLTQLMHGKTVLAVAHRLSTIASLDRLIVLDKGQIVEQGTHQELLEAGGLYAGLWKRQSGGFLGE